MSGAVVADYRLAAEPGYRFIWAAHALLQLSEAAVLDAPTGTPTRIFPEAAPYLLQDWPEGAPWLEGLWPAPLGLALDRFGPSDGTAVGAILRLDPSGSGEVRVTDGRDALRMRLDVEDQPVSVALWRNLGGFPTDEPYRSIGVEPMLGSVFDLDAAGPGDAAVVPAVGELSWRLTMTAEQQA